MRLSWAITIAVFLLFFLAPAWAQDDYELSYLLLRTSDGRVLEAQEEDKLRTPASTMKLVTAAAAFEVLGSEHRSRTSLWTSARQHRGRLAGDLCLKGDADPELGQDDLDDLAVQLQTLGIRRIEGNLVVDEGPFADPPYGTGWAWDDAGEDYQPEVTGLAVDGGVIGIVSGFKAPWLTIEPSEQSLVQLIPGRAGVLVRGKLPDRLAPPNSAQRTGEFLRRHLAQHGIKVRGEVKLGKARGGEIAAHQSRPLVEVLRQALKVSDNLAMELISRSTGSVLPHILQGQRLRQVDGCGLSRYNLISARQLTSVLLAEPRLKEVLPASGEGTLSKRFLEGAAAGQIRAKTGTLSNISALAGYLFPGAPEECVFAVMINGHLDSTTERKAIENRLVESWAQQFGPGQQR